MPVTKRRHPCGHRGHGKTCRRCADATRLEEQAELLIRARLPEKKDQRVNLLIEARRLRSKDGKRLSHAELARDTTFPEPVRLMIAARAEQERLEAEALERAKQREAKDREADRREEAAHYRGIGL